MVAVAVAGVGVAQVLVEVVYDEVFVVVVVVAVLVVAQVLVDGGDDVDVGDLCSVWCAKMKMKMKMKMNRRSELARNALNLDQSGSKAYLRSSSSKAY